MSTKLWQSRISRPIADRTPGRGASTNGRRHRRHATDHSRGQPERMTSEASFAALCGTSPLQTSSGRIVRHRVNQGGNRQSNNALWRIATGRMVRDQRTIEYVERRRTEDKTRREVIRCPKRYTAREIYRLLRNPPQTPHGAELRCLRQKHRIIPRSGHHSPPQPHQPFSHNSKEASYTTTTSPPNTTTGSPPTPHQNSI